jgi:hypothetical protein
MQANSGYHDAIVKSSASQVAEFPAEQKNKGQQRYTFDNVQGGYIIYNYDTLVKLSGPQVVEMLNNGEI